MGLSGVLDCFLEFNFLGTENENVKSKHVR